MRSHAKVTMSFCPLQVGLIPDETVVIISAMAAFRSLPKWGSLLIKTLGRVFRSHLLAAH